MFRINSVKLVRQHYNLLVGEEHKYLLDEMALLQTKRIFFAGARFRPDNNSRAGRVIFYIFITAILLSVGILSQAADRFDDQGWHNAGNYRDYLSYPGGYCHWSAAGHRLGRLSYRIRPTGKVVRAIKIGINCLGGRSVRCFRSFRSLGFCHIFEIRIKHSGRISDAGILILPTIIGASEEALKSVPQTFREASLSLGVSKWQTTYRIVLPNALPGILTGSILGIGRAAGETAPIMFTAAAFFTSKLPGSVFDEVMALPYHVYVLSTAGTNIEATRPIQFGTVLVLVAVVLGIDLIAIIIRGYMRRNKRW